MEMHQLRYFQIIAKTKNFRLAAEQLLVSQPALTKAMQKLEEELNVALFIRQGRGIEISLYGKTFLVYVNEALRQLEQGKERLAAMQDPLKGTIRLAFLQSIGTTLLPTILRDFKLAYPTITFDLMQCSSREALQLLQRDEIDLCLMTNFSHTFNEDNWVEIKTEKLYGYCALSHPLAQAQQIALRDLAQYDFVGFKDQQLMQIQIVKWCKEAGFMPKMVFQGADVPTIAGLVSTNLGIGILPYYTGLESLPIHKFRITDIKCQREIGLAWRQKTILSESAKLFVDFTTTAI